MKSPETFAEFEVLFIDLMHEAIKKLPSDQKRDLAHHVFSSRMQAAYCYCNNHLLLGRGSVSVHDSLECTFKSFKSILATFYANLPEDLRVATLTVLMSNLNESAVEIMTGTAKFAKAKADIILTTEGSGRA